MKAFIQNKTKIIIFSSVLLAIFLFGFVFWFSNQKPVKNPNNNSYNPLSQIPSTRNICLADDEWADYKEIQGAPLAIIILEKNTNKEKSRFEIENVPENHVHAVEVHKCGVYAIRKFNNASELWRYNYSGKGEKVLLFSDYKNISISFGSNFRIDDAETYVALVQSWVGDENHALVIKNLKTMEDAYVVTLKELVEKYGIEPGTISLADWYKQYYRFTVLNDERPFFKINTEDWEMEIFN